MILAEFTKEFYSYWRALTSSMTLTVFTYPKIYMHDPKEACNPFWVPDSDKSKVLNASIISCRVVSNTFTGATQLIALLDVEGNDNTLFTPYAVLAADPDATKRTGTCVNQITDALLDNMTNIRIATFELTEDDPYYATLKQAYQEF